MRLDAELLAIAARQRACVADWQARELGASHTEIGRLHRSRRWSTPVPGVLGVHGTTEDEGFVASAKVLGGGPGARLGFESAASWWGIRMFALLPAKVVQLDPLGHRRRLGAPLHRPRALPDRWTTVHRGIAVVRPELLCYQLCAALHEEKAERAFDVAWNLRLLSVSSARACLKDLAKQGRDGTRIYRRILDERSDKDRPPGSSLESRAQQLFRRAGLRMRRQVDVRGEHWDGRIDFLDEELPLVIEIQSELHHTSLTDERHDAARHAGYDRDGFSVLPLWESDIWTNGDYVIELVLDARRRVRARGR